MKSNAQHLCPRCLIVKGDVPEIGTDLDMMHRLANVRKYPPNHIERAREGLFESGWSISYKGNYDILKSGSWAPIRVCLIFVSALRFADNALAERLLHGARP